MARIISVPMRMLDPKVPVGSGEKGPSGVSH